MKITTCFVVPHCVIEPAVSVGILLFSLFAIISTSTAVPLLPGITIGKPAHEQTVERDDNSSTNKEGAVAQLAEELKSVKSELERIEAPGGFSAGAPPNTSDRDLSRRRFLLRVVVRNVERQLYEMQNFAGFRQKLATLSKQIDSWGGFEEKPPYSLLMVEGLREQAQFILRQISEAESTLSTVSGKKEIQSEHLKKSEENLRLLQEKIENIKEPALLSATSWQRTLELVERKALVTSIGSLEATRHTIEEQLVLGRKELAFIEQKLQLASAAIRFSEKDLVAINDRIGSRIMTLEKRLDAALEASLAAQKSLERISQKLVLLESRVSSHPSGILQKANLEREAELCRLDLETRNFQIESLQEIIESCHVQQLLWELRYASENDSDPGNSRALATYLTKIATEVKRQKNVVAGQLSLNARQISDQETQRAAAENENGRTQAGKLLAEYRIREKIILEKIGEIEDITNLLDRLGGQFDQNTNKASAKAGIDIVRFQALETVMRIWRYEVFTADDTIEVDGKQITGKRGITVGKIVIAVLILLVGYWAASLITRIASRYVVAKYSVSESRATLARKWVMAFILMILVLMSLNMVRIPLTAFAFLGGAIAIGVGFGMQVLLKNLMSGLMLLAERPFRIGDLVEVDSVRGRVTSIGVRSSTIRDVTGIETLIPNSTFIEKNVTNWTYSTNQVRYSIKVGVSYGSPVAVVLQLLYSAARNHKNIQSEPAPLVSLDDFGDDALIFGIHFWLDLDGLADPRIVSSDLRISIEAVFADQGITIAYPQRDVHLDTLKPLQVEVVSGSGL